MCEVDNYLMFFITYAEMYGDFNETYRIIIANTETEIHIVKRAHIFSGYKPYFVRPGHIYGSCTFSSANQSHAHYQIACSSNLNVNYIFIY